MISAYKEISEYFKEVLSTIPAQYLEEKLDGGENAGATKYYMNKKQKRSEKLLIKENSKKAKRLKLDPELNLSQKLTHGDDCIMVTGETKALEMAKYSKLNTVSVDDLKAKFYNKINELQSKRNINTIYSMSKNKKEDRKAKELNKKKRTTKNASNVNKTNTHKISDDANIYNHTNYEERGSNSPHIKENGRMIFSKFDLNANEKPNHKLIPNDPKQAIEKLKKQQEKIDKLKKLDIGKAKRVEENMEWKKASLKSQGGKIKDDPKLLKRALKRKEQKKAKSAKEWQARNEKVKQAISMKHKSRKENIQKRKELKLSKSKRKKTERPGFEGSQFQKRQNSKP